jgi:hypothetical protein
MSEHLLELRPDGSLKFIYSDDLKGIMEIGKAETKRASDVEPTADGQWTADLSKVGGPLLGPYSTRQTALDAEIAWLKANGFGDRPLTK